MYTKCITYFDKLWYMFCMQILADFSKFLLNLIYETLWARAGSALLIAMLEKLNWYVEMNGSALEKKSSFMTLGCTFSSLLDWGSYIISIAKTASKKIGAWICPINFLFPEVAVFLYESTIPLCIEYCCHIWAGATNCYLELL